MDRSGLGPYLAQHLPRELLHRIVTVMDQKDAQQGPFGMHILGLDDRMRLKEAAAGPRNLAMV